MAEVAPALRLLATSCRASVPVLVAACAFVLFTANVFTVFVISPELGGRGGEGRSAKSPLALSLSRSLMSLSLRDDSRCKRVAAIRWLAVFKRTTLGLTAREVT
jgi:hypothetical protein